MKDDLVARLRAIESEPIGAGLAKNWYRNPDGPEAADRIEALSAENDRLREVMREMFEAVCGETGFAQAVRAESGIPYPWPALDRAEAMARAAIRERTGHDRG